MELGYILEAVSTRFADELDMVVRDIPSQTTLTERGNLEESPLLVGGLGGELLCKGAHRSLWVESNAIMVPKTLSYHVKPLRGQKGSVRGKVSPIPLYPPGELGGLGQMSQN